MQIVRKTEQLRYARYTGGEARPEVSSTLDGHIVTSIGYGAF